LKKEAKNFCYLSSKVFWFFFSKKNILPFSGPIIPGKPGRPVLFERQGHDPGKPFERHRSSDGMGFRRGLRLVLVMGAVGSPGRRVGHRRLP
jgi:hypothetical protein